MQKPAHVTHRLLIETRKRVTGTFLGNYRSAFRGAGLDFEELRPYQYGDEVRAIHWPVTARMGSPYLKIYREARELNLMLMLDLSGSQSFGTQAGQKWQTALELTALLGWSAILSGDRMGLTIVTDTVELYRPLRRGEAHLLATFSALERLQLQHPGTHLAAGLDFLAHALKRPSIVLVISDLLDTTYAPALSRLRARHEVLLLGLHHPAEAGENIRGYIPYFDLETGRTAWVAGGHALPNATAQHTRDPDYLPLDVTQDYLPPLRQFLLHRKPTTLHR